MAQELMDNCLQLHFNEQGDITKKSHKILKLISLIAGRCNFHNSIAINFQRKKTILSLEVVPYC